MKILITGAAGNLGSLLAGHLIKQGYSLNLMIHRKDLPSHLAGGKKVSVYRSDLAKPETLTGPCKGVDVLVHFAGVLFMPKPEKFLPVTNTVYFKNLLETAITAKVKKIILISFPHVEGETSPERPARGVLTGNPDSVHARTRLEEEKMLFQAKSRAPIKPVSIRAGMIYGKGVLMIDAARWLAAHWLLGVWRKPTWIHLISIDDFLSALENAIRLKKPEGIYHIGDEGTQTLQEFLDRACEHWGHKKPWRIPEWSIFLAAGLCEIFASIFKTKSPLTRDFIRIGMKSYYGDTSGMRRDLLNKLKYAILRDGIKIL